MEEVRYESERFKSEGHVIGAVDKCTWTRLPTKDQDFPHLPYSLSHTWQIIGFVGMGIHHTVGRRQHNEDKTWKSRGQISKP